MKDTQTSDSLQPGDLVGPWRVEGYAGRGSDGVLYRAQRAGRPGSGPVALKIAVFPSDLRFGREWARRRMFVVAVMSLAVIGPCLASKSSPESPEVTQAEVPQEGMAPDGGTKGLGDDAVTARVETSEVPITLKSVSQEIPKQPLPGQRRPPCQRRWEVVINGGCWKLLAGSEPPCGEGEYEWQGGCYDPALTRTRAPTSTNPQ
jgi:hypothetical protein